jgi:hypothetical protein
MLERRADLDVHDTEGSKNTASATDWEIASGAGSSPVNPSSSQKHFERLDPESRWVVSYLPTVGEDQFCLLAVRRQS